jgi:energy-coupling factor transport system substrate-specific component
MHRPLVVASVGVASVCAAWAVVSPARAALALLLFAGATIVAGAAWAESGAQGARELAVIATIGGAAAAGRVLFAAIPGVQPVTVIVVAAGAALGARAGFASGMLAALASNVFLGQGMWTPWQMLGWGVCGVVGAIAAPLVRGRVAFAVLCCALGLAFGVFTDVGYTWLAFWPRTWGGLTAAVGAGFSFDVAHAVGNLLIALAVGPELRRMLDRYRRRLRTVVVWG